MSNFVELYITIKRFPFNRD